MNFKLLAAISCLGLGAYWWHIMPSPKPPVTEHLDALAHAKATSHAMISDLYSREADEQQEQLQYIDHRNRYEVKRRTELIQHLRDQAGE